MKTIFDFFRSKKAQPAQTGKRYAAARYSRSTGNWFAANSDFNDLLRSSAPIIHARVRQLCRDFPPFRKAVGDLVDFRVGTGIRLQSMACAPPGKKLPELRKQIESRWLEWMDQADVSGQMHFYELQQLICRDEIEAGEYLVLFTRPENKKRHPFALQILDGDTLTDLGSSNGKHLYEQGVEYVERTGERVAYHFSLGRYKTDYVRVPAENVIHGFQFLRDGQLRGISPFTAAILLAKDLDDYVGAEIDGAKMAAKWLAFVESGDLTGWQDNRVQVEDGQRIEELENGIIEYLRTGEKITLSSHDRPGEAFPEFTKFILRLVAVATGVPYELISGNYEGVNYTTLRGVRNDFKQSLRPHQQRQIFRFCRPTYNRWLDHEVLTGAIKIPDYFSNPSCYRKALWIPAGMSPVDPYKEGKSDIEQIAAGLLSPQEAIMSRGRDPEEVLDQLMAWKEMCEERDLDFTESLSWVGSALASNPAAIMGENTNGK